MSATMDCIPTIRPRPKYDTYLRERGYDAHQPLGALGQLRG